MESHYPKWFYKYWGFIFCVSWIIGFVIIVLLIRLLEV